jgi:hypothetical protein
MATHLCALASIGRLLLIAASPAFAQEIVTSRAIDAKSTAAKTTANRAAENKPANVLSPEQWRRVDGAVSRALNWLANQQQPDGSFPTLDSGQPAISSLCVMAFLAHGHVPGKGPYGARLQRATDYIVSCQKPNGLVTKLGPDGSQITREVSREIGAAAAYNHGISSLALSEVYGMSPPPRAHRLESAIRKSLSATTEMQYWPKAPSDQGGWRYVHRFDDVESDLSVTGWELMFLRSARNAGFNVPNKQVDDAIAFVKRSFDRSDRIFVYSARRPSRTRSMAGAGILALAHAGLHHTLAAQQAGDWLLTHGFDQYNSRITSQLSDRYHYGLFICCQAMYQLGGKYWEQFYPPAVEAVLANQQSDGSWPVDSQFHDSPYGSAYTTALVVIMLGAPNQLIPIFQR